VPVDDPIGAYKKGRLTVARHGKRLKGELHLMRVGGGRHDKCLLIEATTPRRSTARMGATASRNMARSGWQPRKVSERD